MAQRRKELDHFVGFNFRVEIDGVTAGAFKSVDGIESSIEVIEFQDGDDLVLRKRPGRAKYGDITLKKGYVSNTQLEDWWMRIQKGQDARKSLSIVYQDLKGEDIFRWNLYDAFISKWKMSSLDGKSNEISTEEITITIERMERVGSA